MYLVKYTASRWRDAAINQTSLRIGSVLHYREIEDKRFRDEDEGGGRIVYRSKKLLTAEVHNHIFAEHSLRLADGWTIDTGGGSLLSEKSEFNAFVFSCALLRRNQEIRKHARQFGADAWYFIKDPLVFADAVALGLKRHLAQAAQRMRMPQSARDKLHRLEVLPIFGLVRYSDDSKNCVVDDGNLNDFQPRVLQLKSFFTKSRNFQGEKEFRFIWLINLGSMDSDEFDLTTTTLRTIDLSNIRVPISTKPVSLDGIYNRGGVRIA